MEAMVSDTTMILPHLSRVGSAKLYGMIAPPKVGIAAFAVDLEGARSSEVASAPRVRCASVVKPLLFWVGADADAFVGDRGAWEGIARPAVTTSDNDATAALWSRVGERHLLADLEDRTGVAWTTDGHGEHPSLRLMVTAAELARAYAAFAFDGGEAAKDLRRWMRDVEVGQTFGVRAVASDVVGAAEASIGVKCGWFGAERVHAVALAELQDRIVGGAVTTSWLADPVRGAACREAAGDSAALVAVHDALAGDVIRAAMRRALLVAADL